MFQTNPLVARIASLFEGQKVFYSSIVYLNEGKKFIINKNEETPYFEKDWQCYSFLRCYANTLITTGKSLFMQVPFSGPKKIFTKVTLPVATKILKRCTKISEKIKNRMFMSWLIQCKKMKCWLILILDFTMCFFQILWIKNQLKSFLFLKSWELWSIRTSLLFWLSAVRWWWNNTSRRSSKTKFKISLTECI